MMAVASTVSWRPSVGVAGPPRLVGGNQYGLDGGFVFGTTV